MKSTRLLAVIISIAILGFACLGDVSLAQSPPVPGENCSYFAETGHYVCGAFRNFYETRGGLEIFGYPLTESFIDPTHEGLRVQYFQRARMEEHPNNPLAYRVQLGLLVDELGYSYPPVPPEEAPPAEDPNQQYFPETQHVVSHSFLTFFRQQGGLDIFGYPRSEMVFEDGLVVQYFQRSRMELHRENPPGDQIILTNVGEMYIERFGVPGDADRPQPPPSRIGETSREPAARAFRLYLPVILSTTGGTVHVAAPTPTSTPPPTRPPTPTTAPPRPTATPSGSVRELDLSASVRYPITGRTGTQTVFIYVNDQDGRPVAGARATAVVHYASGDRTCVAEPTDDTGFTQCSFDIPSPPVGQRVVIDISVRYEGLGAETQAFFMPWW